MKIVAVNHILMDKLFLRRALATINFMYENVFDRYFYLRWIFVSKEHLSGTIIILLAVIQYFQGCCVSDIELICKSSYSHPFDGLPFFDFKRVITATHSFKFTVLLQNRNCSKEILTIIIIPPWFSARIYRISSNKRRVSNKRGALISAVPLGIHIEISAYHLISPASLNATLIRIDTI